MDKTEIKKEGERVMKALKMQRHFLSVEVKKLEQSLPKRKCLNLETHVYGSCFSCEKIKGYNQGIRDCITILSQEPNP